MPLAADIRGTVFKDFSTVLLARVVGLDAVAITQASLTAAEYTIYEIDDDDPDEWTPVDGHEGIDVTVSALIYDTLQTDDLWDADATGYNFKHALDVALGSPFPEAGAEYLIVFTLTPATGQVFPVRFRARCI